MGRYTLKWKCPEIYTEYVNDGAYPDVDVLYKYRDWKNSYHKKLLEIPVIFMASPSSFEDEFDCHVPEDFPLLEELPDLFWEKSFQELPPNTSLRHRREWVDYWCQNTPLADRNKRVELAKEFYQQFCDIFGVLSLTANPAKEEMWQKYAANHKGFCIGYRKEILEAYVGGAGPVIYTKELPHVTYFKDDNMTQYVKNVFFKEAKWDFEQEYRVHKIWNHTASMTERNIPIPVEAIDEIIVGKDIDDKDYEEIKALVESKYPHATFSHEESLPIRG